VAADPRVVRRIEALGTNELQDLILQLTHYAEARVRFRCKWFPSQRLAGGVEGKDIAMDAITRLLQGRRRWDPDAEPDLLAYLKSVVKSILHDRVTETRREAVEADPEDEPPLVDQVPAPNPGPEQSAVAAEEAAATNRMLEALDKEEDQLVFLAILDGTDKPADIAQALNLPVRDIYRIKQKIMRRLLHWKGAN
jgi:RNA polymerase sigma factor (sigma-70 family)